jgi:hypothetical protein
LQGHGAERVSYLRLMLAAHVGCLRGPALLAVGAVCQLGQASGDAMLAPATLSWPSLVGAQKGSTPPNIAQLMTDEQFRALGLTKFSPQERRALNQWVYAYTQAVAKATAHGLDGSMPRRP